MWFMFKMLQMQYIVRYFYFQQNKYSQTFSVHLNPLPKCCNLILLNSSIAIGKTLMIPNHRERGQKVSMVLKRPAGVFPWLWSLLLLFLGTIQEVMYRQAVDGVFSTGKQSSTHHELKQAELNVILERRCPQDGRQRSEGVFMARHLFAFSITQLSWVYFGAVIWARQHCGCLSQEVPTLKTYCIWSCYSNSNNCNCQCPCCDFL